jgi:D-serine dehydratase
LIAGVEIIDPILDGSVKGWPDLGCRASDVGERNLSVDELPTPVLMIREEALNDNVAALAAWCDAQGVLLAPHAKTTMAPLVLRRQLDAGAWGLTVADVRQARVAVACDAQRLILANEVTTEADLRWICERTASGEAAVLFCIDSVEALTLAENEHRSTGGPPLPVLIEIGYEDGRCGLRSSAAVKEVASAIARSTHVALAGVEGFEGLLGSPSSSSTTRRVDAYLERLRDAAASVAELAEVEEPLLTAGGSAYIDRVVDLLRDAATDIGWKLCLRSGCYVTHDHGLYERSAARWRRAEAPRFRPAIEVRASVLSRPQLNRMILGFGRRDVSFDSGLPVVLGDDGRASQELRVVALNDQHAHVDVVGTSEARVGDILRLGISHPCTALDRWRVIPLVNGSGRVVDAITTFF